MLPMVELLRYLEANGFTNYIASGGDRDFMRPVTEEIYGIPSEHVIGSSTGLRYLDDEHGGTVSYVAEMDVFDDGPVKPVRIWSRIGRRPIVAGGNSNGDIPMLEYAGGSGRPALRLLVLHDDAEREFDYTAGAEKSLEQAATHGWTVVSIKNDWAPCSPTDDGRHLQGHGRGARRHVPNGLGRFYPEERPVREVTVEGFWVDSHPVTVAEFRRFVKATGYVTRPSAHRTAADYPDADPTLLVPGSLVFRKTEGPVDLRDYRNWWEWMPGAEWRHPEGPGSNVGGRERHPVTHVAHADADRLRRHGWASRSRPRPNGSTPPGEASTARSSPGATIAPEGADDGEHLAGRVPVAEPAARPLRGHLTGRDLPAERLWPLRHGRERLGVDGRPLHLPHANGAPACCAPQNPQTAGEPSRGA